MLERAYKLKRPVRYSFLDFMGNVLMLQDYPLLLNYTGITNFGTAHVLWTLAIEWWIYLAFGWLVVQWVVWQVVADFRSRLGLALVSLLALPLLVVLFPSKGSR